MSYTESSPIVVGIGEILFDCLPDGKRLGGAPFNFSRFAQHCGMTAVPVSAVGEDADGDQVKELLEYYMGKNTMERQNFIINNLVIEEDVPEEDTELAEEE